MANDLPDATVEPCRITVEPGDLFELAMRLPPYQRREAMTAAMLLDFEAQVAAQQAEDGEAE